MMSQARFTRQQRLLEVGAAGQARIAAARLSPRARGLAGEVEALYLAGAGVGTLVVDDAKAGETAALLAPDVRIVVASADTGGSVAAADRTAPLPAPIAGLVAGARDVGEGAWRALVALRAVLEAA